jgi:hypothetical protein
MGAMRRILYIAQGLPVYAAGLGDRQCQGRNNNFSELLLLPLWLRSPNVKFLEFPAYGCADFGIARASRWPDMNVTGHINGNKWPVGSAENHVDCVSVIVGDVQQNRRTV